MVSSTMSLDNNKKPQHKETNNLTSLSDNSNNNNNSSGVTNDDSFLPPNDKLSLLFPKCKPRNDVNLNQSTSGATTMLQPSASTISTKSPKSATNLNSSSTSQSQFTSYNTQSNNIQNNNCNNNSKQSKLSPEHKNYQHQSAKIHDNYVETNPFRVGNSSSNSNPSDNFSTNVNRYDRYYYNSASSNSSSMMPSHQHHSTGPFQLGYNNETENKTYYMEPDEVEHNPYLEPSKTIATIPSSVLTTTPPATPPALPALPSTPQDLSPIASNRNMWDLSPIKTTTPTKIKNQSPSNIMYSNRSIKSGYKKRIPSDEEISDRNNYFYSKKSYFASLQMENENILNESPETYEIGDHSDLYTKIKSSSKSKMKQSESSDIIYSEAKKKDERKIVKSKSGSGIMEYDGSPRRFGMSSNDDTEYYIPSNYKFNSVSTPIQNSNPNSSPSPPRPGFPQRVMALEQLARSKSPMSKSYSFEDKKLNFPGNSSIISSANIRNIAEESVDTNTASSNIYIEEENHPQSDSTYESHIDSLNLQATSPTSAMPATSTFDYLYEFSETRKVLEEFFKCPTDELTSKLEKFSDFNESDVDSLDIQYDYRGQNDKDTEELYNQPIIDISNKQEEDDEDIDDDNREDNDDDDDEDDDTFVKSKQNGFVPNEITENQNNYDFYLDSVSRSSNGDNIERDNDIDVMNNSKNRQNNKNSNNSYKNNSRRQSKNFHYSPDTTDYDSNYGDFDSESSLRFLATEYGANVPIINQTTSQTIDMNCPNVNNYNRYYSSMPVLEDGLSSGHTSDTENNNTPIPLPNTNDYNISINKRNNNKSNNTNNNANGLISTPPTHNLCNSPVSYQENLVQTNNIVTNNNNNNFYGNNSNNTKINNGNDVEDKKYQTQILPQHSQPPVQQQQHYHSFYTMRNDPKDLPTSTASSIMNNKIFKNRDPELESLYTINTIQLTPPPPAPVPHRQTQNNTAIANEIINPPVNLPPPKKESDIQAALKDIRNTLQRTKAMAAAANANNNAITSPSLSYGNGSINNLNANSTTYYDRSPNIVDRKESPTVSLSPVWVPSYRSRDKSMHSPVSVETGLLSKHKNLSGDEEDEEDLDTDLETDRLLGHQRLDDGFYDDKMWGDRKHRYTKLSPKVSTQPNQKINSSSMIRHGLNSLLPTTSTTTTTQSDYCVTTPTLTSPTMQQSQSIKSSPSLNSANMINLLHPNSTPDRRSDNHSPQKIESLPEHLEKPPEPELNQPPLCSENPDVCNIDQDIIDSPGGSSSNKSKKDSIGDKKKKNKNKEVLIEGVLFRARYLGSTQLVCEGQPTKSTRMMQAEEAVSRIKSPDGENQPSTEVDLFISTEKIMVLNTDLKEIMMDHALRTISYIADIGDLVVLMARRRFVPQDVDANNSDSGTGTGGSGNVSGGSGGPTPPTSGGKVNRTPKMICHVFESEEAQFIAQSIGQAFQVAYMEFLKANGIEDHSFMKEMDYQEVLNSQEIFGDELEIFAKKELQKEVVVPKAKGEILGVVIVESGWGSMLPTVVIANLASNGAAARCGQLNIGDQIIAINGLSLVGLPLSQCQSYIKNTKNQTVVKFTVVPCAPVVEVKIKRPNTKYQLGFSVQNGVICSLLRGGIAERGGVRVGHRIIEINNQSVVAVPHEKIVNLLATSVGEILMKTMPTSMFRLLTGQENPIYI